MFMLIPRQDVKDRAGIPEAGGHEPQTGSHNLHALHGENRATGRYLILHHPYVPVEAAPSR